MPELYDTVISFKQLSSDFLKILDQEETFDVIIHVGDEISSESFKAHSIILRTSYIYGAYLKIEKLGVTEKLQLLKAADILMMDAFVDYLEADLIKTVKSWVNEKTSEVLYVALQISRCKELVSLCNDAILRQPKTFVSSKEFLFMPHDYVVSLLERDILGLDEIDIFAAIIMWGINNTPGISLVDDFSTWTADNITTLQSN
ncbi:6748_t:CDS:2, partial [Scutellospora calospora]